MATDDSTVTYKDVPGFPGYRVGDDGSIWSCRNRGGVKGKVGNQIRITHQWRQMKPSPIGSGHLHVTLCTLQGLKLSRLVHRLVLEAFVGPCPEGMEACHFPVRDPADNRLENLRWDTVAANQADRIAHGTDAFGERNTAAILTTEQVRSIRLERAEGATYYSLAAKYQVTYATIWDVVKRRSWPHIV